MSSELLKIGEFAKCANTNLRTLRYYEELGLIRPAQRSAGKFRFYSPDQIDRVATVKRLQGLGLSLTEIREMLVPKNNGTSDAAEVRTHSLDKQIELISARLHSLSAEYQALVASRAELNGHHGAASASESQSAVACP